jgi:hypothetical protein
LHFKNINAIEGQETKLRGGPAFGGGYTVVAGVPWIADHTQLFRHRFSTKAEIFRKHGSALELDFTGVRCIRAYQVKSLVSTGKQFQELE